MSKVFRLFSSLIIVIVMLGFGNYLFHKIYFENMSSAEIVEDITLLIPSSNKAAWTEEYRETNSKLDEIYTTNNDLKNSGEIYSHYGMPLNKASDQYIQSFFNRLILQKQKLETVKNLNPQETDEYITVVEEVDEELNSLVEDFTSGVDFTPVEIVLDTGEQVIDSGVNGNRTQSLDKKISQKEQIAINTIAQGDDAVDEAEYLVDVFDMSIIYGLTKMPQSCINSYSHNNYDNVIALVCSADTSIIYVNTDYGQNGVLEDYAFLDFIKHEIAHKLIFERCGTMLPEIAGSNYESVTSSYAVQYLGADYLTLQASSDAYSEYKMTDESDKVAALIHDEGKCV